MHPGFLKTLNQNPKGVRTAQPVAAGPHAHAALMDALAVAEFLACFGAACEAPPLALAEVQRAAARPLGGGGSLAALYTALLRCVLLEKARRLLWHASVD